MRRIVTKLSMLLLLTGFAAALHSQNASPRFEPAKVVSTAEAVYPANAVNPGTVVLEVTVGTSGQIEDVKVIRAVAPFTQEALTAIRNWRFSPAKLDGQPIRSVIPVSFSFSRPTVWWPQPNPPGPGATR
jgi:TonB family protein